MKIIKNIKNRIYEKSGERVIREKYGTTVYEKKKKYLMIINLSLGWNHCIVFLPSFCNIDKSDPNRAIE